MYDGRLAWDTSAPAVKRGATTILTANGTPLIVRSELGAGRVVWSGLNLPYHAAAFKNLDEARLFAQLLSTASAREPEVASGETRYVDPQHLEIDATDSRGVLVKENLAADWKARVDGHPARIYPAGLDFMWVPMHGAGTHDDHAHLPARPRRAARRADHVPHAAAAGARRGRAPRARGRCGGELGRVVPTGARRAQQQPDLAAAAVRPSVTGSAAPGAQHVAVSPAPTISLVSWSESPVLTYHSHLAPSGSVTQVSTLVA